MSMKYHHNAYATMSLGMRDTIPAEDKDRDPWWRSFEQALAYKNQVGTWPLYSDPDLGQWMRDTNQQAKLVGCKLSQPKREALKKAGWYTFPRDAVALRQQERMYNHIRNTLARNPKLEFQHFEFIWELRWAANVKAWKRHYIRVIVEELKGSS